MNESPIYHKPILMRKMKLEGVNPGFYLMRVIDLYPEGIVVLAESHIGSITYKLPISEIELTRASITRHTSSLADLLNSLHLVSSGDLTLLESTIEDIKSTKDTGGDDCDDDDDITLPIDDGINSGTSEPIQELLVTGLLELCRVKLIGDDAIQWLGEWLIENNPNKVTVNLVPDDSMR